MKPYQAIVTVLLIAIAFIAILYWADKRDEAVMISAERYEECVRNEYHTTPSAWYAEHGEYPVCESK